ncbi:MAG TPA: hypothetical protein VEB60_01610, partial [Candidatus Paceibacterota bacterium]|nr:hypothetical protein [Candidatus Paceibacterota bacterium]
MKRSKGFSAAFRAAAVLSFFAAVQILAPLSVFAAGGWVTLDSFSGYPGVNLQVSGGGWVSGDTIKIYLGTVDETPEATAPVVDGMFAVSVRVPAATASGPLAIIAKDGQGDQSANSYYVAPRSADISVEAVSHAPFGRALVSGSGFMPNETVTLTLASATS